MQFPTERSLGAYVREAHNKCGSDEEFTEWLNKNADKHTVIDVIEDGEPLTYSATDLAELEG